MKTSLNKRIISLLMGLGTLVLGLGFGFAQTLPTYNENRTITNTGATMSMSNGCNPYKAGAFYEGSDVYFFLLSETLRPDSYGIFKESYARVYGYNSIIPNTLKLPFIANIQPKDGSPGLTDTKMLITEARNAQFTIPSGYAGLRNQPAAQIITKNHYRLLRTTTPNISYFYTNRAAPTTQVTMSASQNFSNNVTWKTACYTYYVARCGDNVVDKPTGSTDGNGGIQTATEGFIEWNDNNTVTPNEVCDEGALNGTPGHCKLDCSGMGSGPVGGASCSLVPSMTTIESGQSVTLNASYSSGTSATFTPSLSGLAAFTYPSWSSTITDTPITTTTYTLTVQGPAGTQPAVCPTTVTVTQPEPHLQCTLTINPSIAGTGQIINIGWNVQNGTFDETDIYVTPGLAGGRPHTVYDNQYNGITTATAMYTGQYIFTMHVANSEESADCTGILNVIDDVAPCSLTTTTPVINIGETAILQGIYTNGILANMTPFITGLNFTYPNRSNTNIAVQPTSTTTYTMNVLGILGGSGKSCSTTVQVRNPGLEISKHVVTDIQYNEGDLVTFRLDFANNSSGTINNVNVSDYLPVSLDYVNSQIYGVTPPFNYTTGTIPGSHHFVTYSAFSLAPGQQGYILVVGRYRGNQYANYTINNATIQGDDSDPDYASAIFQTYKPTSSTTVTKTSNKPSYYPGEHATFTIGVTNNGPDTINNVTITDNRPTSSCVTLNTNWIANMALTVGSSTNPYTWIYNGSLAPGQTIYLYLTGMISNDPSCIGTYTNNAHITYVVNNQTHTGAAQPLNFTVSTTPSSTMVFEKRLVSYGSNPGDPVVFELLYRNNGGATISNFDVVDYRPGTLNFVSASPMPTTQIPMPGGTELHRFMTTPLAPNGSGKITINGTIH